MEEKVSLSDRFGLWVPFHLFSQERYLDAVRLCVERQARERKVEIPWSPELEQDAVKWSRNKSKAVVEPLSSSPRTGSGVTC